MFPPYMNFRMQAQPSDLDYEIFVYVPESTPPAGGFPTLYVLDANSDFLLVAETVRRVSKRPQATGIGEAIVVGIGYPNTRSYDLDRRYFDFTCGPSTCPSVAGMPISSYGGQRLYIRFLAEQLLPYIASKFPTNPARRSLIGHSLAGYFVLDLLVGSHKLFSGHVSFSPSIWWDRDKLVSQLDETWAPASNIKLYMTVGRYEQELAPWQRPEELTDEYRQTRQYRRMVDNTRDMAELMTRRCSSPENLKFELGVEDDHSTIFNTFLCRALRHVNPV